MTDSASCSPDKNKETVLPAHRETERVKEESVLGHTFFQREGESEDFGTSGGTKYHSVNVRGQETGTKKLCTQSRMTFFFARRHCVLPHS